MTHTRIFYDGIAFTFAILSVVDFIYGHYWPAFIQAFVVSAYLEVSKRL